jgi:hypothetical protein
MGAAPFGALVVLLDEAAAADPPRADALDLHKQAEKVGSPTAKAELVVDEPLRGHFRRKALIRMSYCWASRE